MAYFFTFARKTSEPGAARVPRRQLKSRPLRRSAARVAAAVGVTVCLSQCGGQQAEHAVSLLPDTLELREGDVVFRRCSGLTSRVVTWYDRSGAYSHTGIVVDSAGVMMVVHAVPGEPDFPGDPDRVKMERPEQFFSASQAVLAAVRRPKDAEAGQRAARVALRKYREGVRFDHHFDDTDTTELYCTELITHAYRQAGVELVGEERHVVNLPGAHYRCILPSQVEQSAFLTPLYTFTNP